MKTAVCSLEGIAPYSSSRAHEEPKLDRETADAYEERTWRNKAHLTDKGQPFIPPMAFKFALDAAAKQLSVSIPGKGKKTYTNFFLTGVMVVEPIVIAPDCSLMKCERVYANADGVRGSGKRVWRKFPRWNTWAADVPFMVLAAKALIDYLFKSDWEHSDKDRAGAAFIISAFAGFILLFAAGILDAIQ